MASMDMDKQLEDQQSFEDKPKMGDSQEPPENAEIKDANLEKSAEEMDKVTETSITTMDLPHSSHRKLPAELNREIFLCFKPATQRKFIWGLGWDFYTMFRQKLLKKTKRLCNPKGNRLNGTNTSAIISRKGLNAKNNTNGWVNILAAKEFTISGQHCRENDFPGTVLYYFEVKILTPTHRWSPVGFSATTWEINWFGDFLNSYAISTGWHSCRLNGRYIHFEYPDPAIRPEKKNYLDVFGSGLVLDPKDKLSIFFTLNGKLMGWKIPISPTVDRLFPAVTMLRDMSSIEANFGDDKAKPFEYDIQNCPGLGLDCV